MPDAQDAGNALLPKNQALDRRRNEPRTPLATRIMRNGDRIAYQLVTAVGILVPLMFVGLDLLGVAMPGFYLVDHRLGLPIGTSWSLVVAMTATGLALSAMGIVRIRMAGRHGGPASEALERSGWIMTAGGAMVASLAVIGMSMMATLP